MSKQYIHYSCLLIGAQEQQDDSNCGTHFQKPQKGAMNLPYIRRLLASWTTH